MESIGSFSFMSDGRVSQRLRIGGRLGGRVRTWHVVGVDEVNMVAVLRDGAEEITAPIGKRQLAAALAGLNYLRGYTDDARR